MNDLLSDSIDITGIQSSRGGDVDMEINPLNSVEFELQNFSKKVQEIEEQYNKLNHLLRRLDDAHEESKVVTEVAAMKSIKHRMEKDVDEVQKVFRLVRSKIEDLISDNLSNMQKPGCGKGTATERVRKIQTFTLKMILKEKMSKFQTLLENIHQEYREVVELYVYILTCQRPDEQTIDRLIETGESEQIFEEVIQLEQGRGEIIDILQLERYDALRYAERELIELQKILLDMSNLFEDDKREYLLDNNIESHVSSAVDHHVKSGNTTHRSYALLIIAVIVVVGVLKPWQKKNGA